jgi:hypothetical protein
MVISKPAAVIAARFPCRTLPLFTVTTAPLMLNPKAQSE